MNAFRTDAIDLGRGFAIKFSLVDGRFDAVWSPRMPHGRRLRQVLPAYRRARHDFLSGVAEKLGITIAVADVGPTVETGHG